MHMVLNSEAERECCHCHLGLVVLCFFWSFTNLAAVLGLECGVFMYNQYCKGGGATAIGAGEMFLAVEYGLVMLPIALKLQREQDGSESWWLHCTHKYRYCIQWWTSSRGKRLITYINMTPCISHRAVGVNVEFRTFLYRCPLHVRREMVQAEARV